MPVSLFQYLLAKDNIIREVMPSPAVRDVIAGFYIIPAQDASLALNDGMPAIAFTEGSVEVITAKVSYTIEKAWLSSQYLENIRLSHAKILVVRFHPISFYKLFRIKPAALRSRDAWALPAALGERGEKLLAENTIAGIEAFITKLKGEEQYSNALLQQALHYIQQQKGNVVISKMGNYKWLERNFSDHIGLSPKEYARLLRFIHSYSDVLEGQGLLDIAINNGYYDQNHFSKEFRKFTGKPPREYLRKLGKLPA